MQAAHVAIQRQRNNRFRRKYERLILKGVKPGNAKKTIARDIATIMYTMWLRGTEYVNG